MISMSRGAYTLLEVLIATAVLVVGLIAVFSVSRAAQKKSVDASELAAAQLAAQTLLNELLAAEEPIRPIAFRPLEGLRFWKIAVNVHPTPENDLLAVLITSQKFTPQGDMPTGVPYHLVRWVPRHRVQLPRSPEILDEREEFDDPFR